MRKERSALRELPEAKASAICRDWVRAAGKRGGPPMPSDQLQPAEAEESLQPHRSDDEGERQDQVEELQAQVSELQAQVRSLKDALKQSGRGQLEAQVARRQLGRAGRIRCPVQDSSADGRGGSSSEQRTRSRKADTGKSCCRH